MTFDNDRINTGFKALAELLAYDFLTYRADGKEYNEDEIKEEAEKYLRYTFENIQLDFADYIKE